VSSSTEAPVGFIGLGNMGWLMARNLRQAGRSLVVYDLNESQSARFVEEFGGVVASSPADFAPVGVVVTMLPDGRAVAQALIEGGVGAALAPGAVVVDMSSSSPLDTQALGPKLAELGVALVDAPVSGGIARADSGELTLMVGGDDDAAIDRAVPVLDVLGGRIFRTGPLGSGHAMKALNNFLGAAAYTATAEALAVGQRFGLSGEVMIDVINNSTGRSFNSEVVFKGDVLPGRYATNFALALLAKDVGIAASLAQASELETPLCALVNERWAQALEELGQGRDHSEAHKGWWDVVFASQAAAGEGS
jgi:3-hydroxyisobutyrate dehydrogenase